MLESVENMTYNGVDLAQEFTDGINNENYFIVNEVRGRGVMSSVLETLNISGMLGGYIKDPFMPERRLEVDITVKAESFEALRRKIERLGAVLYTDKPVAISFADEPNRTYYGRIGMVYDNIELSKIYKATLTIICEDPRKYGDEQTAVGNPAQIVNEGTAPSYPIISMDVVQDTTFIKVDNGHDFNMAGEPASVDDTPFEPTTTILNDPMTSTVGWGAAGFTPDGSIKAGTIGTDGQSLIPVDYGAGTSWHGPALQKSLSEQLQDFSVEFTFAFSAETIQELGKIQLYGLDAANKRIFMLGMANYWREIDRNMPEGQLYNDLEQRYPVLVRNAGEDWNKFYGYMKITRVGQQFTIILNKVNRLTNESIAVKQKTYFDTDNKYQKLLSGVGIHFAKFGDYAPITSIGAGHITVSRINQNNGIPYIFRAGDKVVFDHHAKIITRNGEDITREKVFIGNYFPNDAGDSVISVEPPEAVSNVEVRWRPAWL